MAIYDKMHLIVRAQLAYATPEAFGQLVDLLIAARVFDYVSGLFLIFSPEVLLSKGKRAKVWEPRPS